MQTARPEAMCRVTGNNEIGELEGQIPSLRWGSVGTGTGRPLPQALVTTV